MTVSRPRGRAPCHCPSGPVLRSRSRSVHCANPPDPSTQSIPPSLRLRMERPAPPLARVPCLECTCVCGHAPLDCLAAATGPRPVFPDLLAAATTPDLELYKMSTRSWARPSMSGVVTIMNRMVVDCAGQHRSLPLPILRLKSGVADESGERVLTHLRTAVGTKPTVAARLPRAFARLCREQRGRRGRLRSTSYAT